LDSAIRRRLINSIEFEVSPLIKTVIPSVLVKCTLKEQKLVLFENANQHNLAFSPRGGVLADEMGLGKTMEMLGLILSNPMKQAPKSDPYFATKATLGKLDLLGIIHNFSTSLNFLERRNKSRLIC
jgi:SNF2 family DNA or RNA helicase